MDFNDYELSRLSSCILAKMDALNACYKTVLRQDTKNAIAAELDELKKLNDKVCGYASRIERGIE